MLLKNHLSSWPKYLCVIAAIIPVVVLIFIVVNLIVTSQTLFQDPLAQQFPEDLNKDGVIDQSDTVGWKGLFSTEAHWGVTTQPSAFGIIPGIIGTALVVLVAIGIAFPVSLLMAIFASEFTLGFIGKGMRTLLGVLAGIPSIVYALMSFTLAQVFLIPKLHGNLLFTTQPPGMDWYDPFLINSIYCTFQGGLMLSLLVIPFLAPMFDDALRDVPHPLKEASLALGANRWHTLINVTIPAAFSGILSALNLGILKAMGDVVIVSLCISMTPRIPSPVIDIMENPATLTSAGASLSGGFSGSTATSPLYMAAASFSGITLLFLAIVLLIIVPILQRKFKKRYALNER